MSTLWYLSQDSRICADVIEGGQVVRCAGQVFPNGGSPALFWLIVSALASEVKV